MHRQAFHSLAALAGLQDSRRGSKDAFPVPFDYLQRVFRFDDRKIYVKDSSFEDRLKTALELRLPSNRESWLFRAEPEARFFEPVPEDVDDLAGIFRRLAEINNGPPRISASPEIFYSAYYDWAGRMGLALGIKKEIYTREQAGMETTVFAMHGFFDGDNTFHIHKICRPDGFFMDNRVQGLQPVRWYQDAEIVRDLTYAQDLAETLFRGDHMDVTAIWNRNFKSAGILKVPAPWAAKP